MEDKNRGLRQTRVETNAQTDSSRTRRLYSRDDGSAAVSSSRDIEKKNGAKALTERQLKKYAKVIGEAGKLWIRRCEEWVTKNGDPGPAERNGCISIDGHRPRRTNLVPFVLIHTYYCTGNQTTFFETSGEVISYLANNGLRDCFYDEGGLLDDFSGVRPHSSPTTEVTNPSSGTMESVESPTNNSTVPPVPQGDRAPVDSGPIMDRDLRAPNRGDSTPNPSADAVVVEDGNGATVAPAAVPAIHIDAPSGLTAPNLIRPGVDYRGDFGVVTVSVPSNHGGKVSWEPVAVTSNREVILVRGTTLVSTSGSYVLTREPMGLHSLARWPNECIIRFVRGEDVEPLALFQRILALHRKYLDYCDAGTAEVLTLWGIGTYFFPLFRYYPYAHLNGPTISGKSKQAALTAHLGLNGIHNVDPTGAVIYRLIESGRATICLDECEDLTRRKNPEMVQILNAGHAAGGQVLRCVDGGRSVQEHDVFSPKMFGTIYPLEYTLANRCIPVQFLRTMDQERAERGVELDSEPWDEIRHGLYTLALTNFRTIRGLYSAPPVRPFANRQNDNWAPILALARFFQDRGAAGLVDTVIKYAKRTVTVTDDVTLPAYDLAALRMLKQHSQLEDPFTLTPQRLLEMVRKETGRPWRGESPESTGHMLRRLGFRRGASRRDGSSYEITRAQIMDLYRRYSVSIDGENTSSVATATSATSAPAVVSDDNSGGGGIAASTPSAPAAVLNANAVAAVAIVAAADASTSIAVATTRLGRPPTALQGTKILTMQADRLLRAVKAVGFLALRYPGDSDCDNIWFFPTDHGLLLGITDDKRGALVRVPVDIAATELCVGVDCELLKRVLSTCGPKETVELYADGDFLTLDSKMRNGEPVSNRFQMPGLNKRKEFLKLRGLRDITFSTHVEIQHRRELITALKRFGREIKGVGIKAEAGKTAIEIQGANGITAAVSCTEVKQGLSRVIYLSTLFLRESLKQIKGEKVVLSFEIEKKRARLQSENTDYTYITVESQPEVTEQ